MVEMQIPWGAANFVSNMYAGEDAQVFVDPTRATTNSIGQTTSTPADPMSNIAALMNNRQQLVHDAADLSDGLIHHRQAPQPRDAPENIMAQFTGLQAFSGRDRLRQLMLERRTQVDEESPEIVNVHREPGYLRFTRPPGMNPSSSMPVPMNQLYGIDQAVHSRTIDTFDRIHIGNAPNILEARIQRRQQAAHALHNMMASGRLQRAELPQQSQQEDLASATLVGPTRPMCAICYEPYEDEELVTLLQCTHHYHQICFDNWAGIRLRERSDMDCPMCRQEAITVNVQPASEIDMPAFHLEGTISFEGVFGTPSDRSLGSMQSSRSQFVIFPPELDNVTPGSAQRPAEQHEFYHSLTQIKDHL